MTIDQVKLAVVIPNRQGIGRELFMSHCMRMMVNQRGVKPRIVVVDQDFGFGKDVSDITIRYISGYELIRNSGFDLIACIENDDWYASDYLATMVDGWLKAGRPDIFGIEYTYYYHVKLRRYFKYKHSGRSSMMSTFIKTDLSIDWPARNERFLDMRLWHDLRENAAIIAPDRVINISIKHGDGITGGTGHTDRFHRYKEQDNGFLAEHVDPESLKFYESFYEPRFQPQTR